MAITNITRAWLYLVPLIPSVFVSVFVLYHILRTPALGKAYNNHVIILLLVIGLIFELTEVVFDIAFYFKGVVLSSAVSFCLTWTFIGSSTNISIYFLMAWASIERHIIIFYPNLLATKKKCFFFHYLPLAVCILYPTMFYFVTLFILTCHAPFNASILQCNRYSCIFLTPLATKWDSIVNNIVPSFITVIFSVALFVRVLYKRYRARGRIDWRNYKKMAGQLLPISVLYMTLQFPPMIMYSLVAAGQLPNNYVTYFVDSLAFLYWTVFFTPFAVAISLPDVQTKCRNLLFWRRRRAVGPATLTMVPRNVGQSIAVVPVAPVAAVLVAPVAAAPVAPVAAVLVAPVAATPVAPVAVESVAPAAVVPVAPLGAVRMTSITVIPVAVLPDVQ